MPGKSIRKIGFLTLEGIIGEPWRNPDRKREGNPLKKDKGRNPSKKRGIPSPGKKRVILSLFFWMVTALTCSYGEEEVTLQLRWDHQFQFAGYYAALWEGYYEEAGFDVRIVSGFDESREVLSAPKEVGEGRADFGIGASDILTYREQGYDFTVVASIFQRSPVEFYMKADTPYQSLVDFMDLKVGRRENDLLDIELRAMLIQEGMDPERLPKISGDYDFSIEDLTEGNFDVIPGYLGTIPYEGELQGVELRRVRPIDYGIDFYGDSLFTNREYALKNPERVHDFKEASLKGWQYALENPEEIIDKLLGEFHDPERMSREEYRGYNEFQKEQVLEYSLYPVVSLGNINPHRWEEMEEILVELEVLEEERDFQNFIFDYRGILEAQRQRVIRILLAISLGLGLATVLFFVYYITSKKTMDKLQVLVEEAVKENQRQEGIILYQSRLAAMGEMIGHIAHQWRQPLNQLNLMITNVAEAHQDGELKGEEMEEFRRRSRTLIYKMSETIDDFRYFFKPQKKKEIFDVRRLIRSTVELLKDPIRLRDITLEIKEEVMEEKTGEAGFLVRGYGNYFSQGMFNLVHNALDSVEGEEKEHRRILIEILDYKDTVKILIRDWGSGVSEEDLPRIFERYFTTKEKKYGTGLGMYITKTIVEDHLWGTIGAENTEKGFQVIIEIPKGG